MTVSPQFLEELSKSSAVVERRLSPGSQEPQRPPPVTESEFLITMNGNEMADFKLSEGIRKYVGRSPAMRRIGSNGLTRPCRFCADLTTLEKQLKSGILA